MERVVFLIEDTGERISCLLNPESLVLRRQTGVARRASAGGLVAGAELADDPLLFTGGGCTELSLDLLFDITLDGSTIQASDVRELTGPLWELSENARAKGGYGRPPLARFFWGKSWNVPGIVTAVAERLEYFTPEGAPRRSWLRLRMARVVEPPTADRQPSYPTPMLAGAESHPIEWPQQGLRVASDHGVQVHEVKAGERPDQIAYLYLGLASSWRPLAAFNGLLHPLRLEAGMRLRIPPLHDLAVGP